MPDLEVALRYYRQAIRLDQSLGASPAVEIPDIPPPLTVSNPEAQELWPLTLREAIEIALDNSGVVRRLRPSGRGFVATAAEDLAPTVYDPAEAETAIEEALGIFDATLSMALFWSHSRRLLNNNVAEGIVVSTGEIFERDAFGRSAAAAAGAGSLLSIQKRFATGAIISASFDTDYDLPNLGRRLYRSAYETTLTFTLTQPLLRNAGIDTNRVPLIIARVRADQELWTFRQAVERLVRDVEQAYWQLSGAQRVLAAVDEAVRVHMEIVRRLQREDAEGRADPGDLAQAQAELARIRRMRDLALGQETGPVNTLSGLPGSIQVPGVLAAERQLRSLLGLPPSDGRRIVAVDEPTIAPIEYDWHMTLAEAFTFHPEMQRLKLEVAARRQELLFRRNQLLPEVNFFWQHTFWGLGDGFDDSVDMLTDTRFGDYTFGLQGSVTLGRRTESARLQAAVYRLARAKALLRDKGHEVSHVLAQMLQELDMRAELYRKSLESLAAAKRSLEIQRERFEAGQFTIDQLLDAERAYYEAVNNEVLDRVAFQTALIEFEMAKGTILRYN
ncbi:MAG TPA: TolC family protein, partial [Planctomycetaceae bacterium]|nr:TolC family protein [Planctomycetaceae bacterium]